MNAVNLIGRLTRDPQMSYTTAQLAIARFSVAIDRGKDKGADFPNIVCFGKTAELVEKYTHKGDKVAVSGRLQTGSYENSEGQKVYTTDVIADRVEFLTTKSEVSAQEPQKAASAPKKEEQVDIYGSFSQLTDDDIPF